MEVKIKKKKNKKEHTNKPEPIKVRDTLIMAILPVFFGLMGIISIDAAQPLTDILLASCIFLVILALVLPIYLKLKGINYSHDWRLYIRVFGLLHADPCQYIVFISSSGTSFGFSC